MTFVCLFGCKARANWSEVIPPPKKPDNYKDETWEKKLPDKLKELEATAPYHFLGGEIINVMVAPEDGKIASMEPETFLTSVQDQLKQGHDIRIVTIHATDRFRQLLWTCAQKGIQPIPATWAAASENRGLDYRDKLLSGESG